MKEQQEEQSQHPLILDNIVTTPTSSSNNNVNDHHNINSHININGDLHNINNHIIINGALIGKSEDGSGDGNNTNRKKSKRRKIEEEDDEEEYPIGYKWCPHDDELIVHYLKNKIFDHPLPHNKIPSVNLYHYNPDTLAAEYKPLGENEWYFFTPRDKKYRNGLRPNRAAGTGYWKATGSDKNITNKDKNIIVGHKKALVFYQGRPPKGEKTNWIMHEFRIANAPACTRKDANDMRLDNWVLCKIHEKAGKGKGEEGREKEVVPIVKSDKVVDEPTIVMNDDHHNDERNLELIMSGDSNPSRLVEYPYTNNYDNSTSVQLPPFPPYEDFYTSFAHHHPPQQLEVMPISSLSHDTFVDKYCIYPQTGIFGISHDYEHMFESEPSFDCNSMFPIDMMHINAQQYEHTKTMADSCTEPGTYTTSPKR